MPEFLSDDWIAEIDAALGAAAAPAPDEEIVIEQVVVGVPERGDVRYQVRAGRTRAHATPVAAAAQPADVRIRTDYATARAIASGRENAQHALAAGRLRVSGDIDRLIRCAAALATLAEATASTRAATTFPPS